MEFKCNIRSVNCFNENMLCHSCSHNDLTTNNDPTDYHITVLDKINELYGYLTGNDMPEGVHAKSPKLAYKQAFTVIWFLQEHMNCLPDHIEQCKECDELYDTDREGYCLDDQYELDGKTLPKKYWGHFCDGCVPNVDFTFA